LKNLIVSNFEKLINKTTHDEKSFFGNGVYTFLNYTDIDLAGKDVDYNNFTKIGIHGILLVWIIRFFRLTKVKRFSFDFRSLATYIFEDANISKKSMVIIGSDTISNSKFVNHINKRYPFIKIVYSRNGYFDSDFEKKNVIEKISQLRPEIIIIGMGTKYQDKFALNIWDKVKNCSIYTCGGFIHQISINVNTYPSFINKYNLRFIYRFFNEKGILKKMFPRIFLPFIVIPFLKIKSLL
jgi:N-acetylglucosaminyldiphosphoundecaprenol N-acetyl-beta-D-mannosaminyltransferase